MTSDVDVLLINPPRPFILPTPAPFPPLGLAYVGAALEDAGYKVSALDCHHELVGFDELPERIGGFNPRIVGLTGLSVTRFEMFRAAEIVREVHPHCVLVGGGVHVSFTARETVERTPFDIVCRFEGERTMTEVAGVVKSSANRRKALEGMNRVRGVTYRTPDGAVHENPERELVQDLDLLPLPARHLFPMGKYFKWAEQQNRMMTNIVTSRGCPFRCPFCSASALWGHTYRLRSPDNVGKELQQLKDDYGIASVEISDSTFTVNHPHVLGVVEEMKKAGFQWDCYVQVETLTPELLTLMQKGGCRRIKYGVEAGNDEIRKRAGKNFTTKRLLEVDGWAKRAGLEREAFFMFGLPRESMETVQETYKLAAQMMNDGVELSVAPYTCIYPGTDLEKFAIQEGILPPNFSWTQPVDRFSGLSAYLAEVNGPFLFGQPIVVSSKLDKRALESISFFMEAMLEEQRERMAERRRLPKSELYRIRNEIPKPQQRRIRKDRN
ncbi:MAG: radical SAM protein [Candidatus Altiarchaeota archaeon]